MALEILEGWTHYDQNDILVKWDTLNDYSHILISAAYGRNGAGASILTGGASVGHNLRTSYAIGTAPSVMFEKYFSSNITNINIGFAIKLNDVEFTLSLILYTTEKLHKGNSSNNLLAMSDGHIVAFT